MPLWIASSLSLLAMTRTTLRAQQRDQLTAVGEVFESHDCADQRVLLLVAHDAARQLAELGDDVVGASERLLAAARRLARLALDRTVAPPDLDPHLVAERGAGCGDV